MLKYHVRAQPSSTEAATLSSPDSDDDQTRPNCLMNTLIQLFAFCYKPGVTRKKRNGNQHQALKVFTVCVDNKKIRKCARQNKFCPVSAGLSGSVGCASDWRPGGRGFDPRRGRQHSFVEIDHEIFSTVILSLPLIQEGQLSVSGERMCIILVNRLEDKACPVNVWLGKLTALDMTPLG